MTPAGAGMAVPTTAATKDRSATIYEKERRFLQKGRYIEEGLGLLSHLGHHVCFVVPATHFVFETVEEDLNGSGNCVAFILTLAFNFHVLTANWEPPWALTP